MCGVHVRSRQGHTHSNASEKTDADNTRLVTWPARSRGHDANHRMMAEHRRDWRHGPARRRATRGGERCASADVKAVRSEPRCDQRLLPRSDIPAVPWRASGPSKRREHCRPGPFATPRGPALRIPHVRDNALRQLYERTCVRRTFQRLRVTADLPPARLSMRLAQAVDVAVSAWQPLRRINVGRQASGVKQ